jgi:branched-chain amino acid transport system ATP-binding protein
MLTIQQLNQFYGGSHTLWDVDMVVPQGSVTCLMGRNGMGKTTLLRSMLGFLPPREGRVLLRGEEVTREMPHRIARAGIAYVPEGRGIFPNLSVRENLVMAARAGAEGRRDWTLEHVLATFPRLAERLDYGGQQLSGGEQQMLTIGRALMTNPDLLILDEATEGLAPLVAREIWTILGQLRESGISAVIVDKNFAAVSAVVDRIVVLVKGSVVFSGSPVALRNDPVLQQRHLGV